MSGFIPNIKDIVADKNQPILALQTSDRILEMLYGTDAWLQLHM